MKRIILGICLLLFVTGCSVSYDVYIGEDIEEVISIDGDNFNTFPVPAFYYEQGASESNEKIEGIEYYSETKENNSKVYKYNFNLDNYKYSTGVNTCLSSLKVSKNIDGYMINTGSDFSCFGLYPNLNYITVNLVFDITLYEIDESNADSVRGNVYTWNVTKDNYKNKYIQIVFKDKEEVPTNNEEELNNEKSNSNYIVFIAFIGFLTVLVGIIYLKYRNVNKKNRF